MTPDGNRAVGGRTHQQEEILMVRKKTEGDEDQRRAAAREARRADETPSAEHATTGSSKQRTHMPHRSSLTHEDKVAHIHEGKQGKRRSERSAAGGPDARTADRPSERTFQGRGSPEYTDAHEQVFRAVADTQQAHGGEAVHLHEIARAAHRPAEETRTLLHDLTSVHGLVTQLQGSDTPDLGPRYETRPGT